MVHSSNESQQTQTFSIDHENVLPDHYRLIELIGRGGMAEVYLAEDRRLGRKVAIKFLNPEFRRDPDRVRRFRQEARSASALNHPNILIIHDIGDSGGVQFIVSELVDGETLGTRIAQGKLPFAEGVDVAIQTASALTAAHAAGIVHRDIKPDNVMIRHDEVVKVLDFGLAKARGFTTLNGGDFDAMTLDSGSTSPGLIVGTPQYMSPEQARGKELDGRTDIFSLGIIIFEMVTRHSPFAGGSFADTMAAILTKEPRQMTEFVEGAPPRLIALVEKCLRKDREERFASMAEVETELKALRAELAAEPTITAEIDPIKSDRTQIRPTDQHSIRRFASSKFVRPSPVGTVIILAAALLLAGGWWAWDRVSTRSPSPSLMRTVPITSWSSTASELVTSASFSPDGKMVAFSTRRDDSTEIWVKPVIGGDPVQVTKDGGYNQYPVWSPDGQQIAFVSNRGNSRGIWRIPFTGGNIESVTAAITPSARLVRWSNDGFIYFQSGQEMFKVPTDEGKAIQVTNFSQLGSAVRIIEVSPDSKFVAYSVVEESGWKLKVRSFTGGRDQEIASTRNQIDQIAWHPNGNKVFASFLIEGVLQIVEASIDGSEPAQRSNGDHNFIVHDVAQDGSILYGTLLETSDLWHVNTQTGAETIVANDVPSEYWPDVAPDGSIAFQSATRVERPDLSSVLLHLSGDKDRLASVSTSGFLPMWSNTGDWIAFIRKGANGNELWKSRPNGTELTRLSDFSVAQPGYYMAPYLKMAVSDISWSPDDSRIAVAGRANGDSQLWITATDGSKAAFLVANDEGVEVSPIWTRDARSIAYTSVTGASPTSPERRHRIMLSDVASRESRLLFESRDAIRILGFRAGDKEIVYALNPNTTESLEVAETIDIYSVDIANGRTKKITGLRNTYHYNVHFSASANLIAFVTRFGSRTSISTISLEDVNLKELVVINDPKILISSLGIARDGSFIVFGKQTRTNLLSMLAK